MLPSAIKIKATAMAITPMILGMKGNTLNAITTPGTNNPTDAQNVNLLGAFSLITTFLLHRKIEPVSLFSLSIANPCGFVQMLSSGREAEKQA